MKKLLMTCLFIILTGTIFSQTGTRYRGSIPEVLLRPGRTEAPRYPVDIVIGVLGKGSAQDAAYSYANWVAGGLLSGRMNHPALENISPAVRERYLSALGTIEPRFYRIGGGRVEPDGSTSFLLRFVGREYGITAEMYIRHDNAGRTDSSESADSSADSGGGEVLRSGWRLEDLLLDEAKSRAQEDNSSIHRVDSIPYERFF